MFLSQRERGQPRPARRPQAIQPCRESPARRGRLRLNLGDRIRHLLAIALAVCILAGVAAERRAVLTGSGHLLFDLNPAEQGFVRVVTPWLEQPLGSILSDPSRRTRFLRDSQAVGNQVHGTLALSTAAVHQAARAGAPLGTLTLRRIALACSTLTLGLWLLALGRTPLPGARRVRAFLGLGLLWALAPVVLLKLSVVHWGTHEVVMLLHAAFVALFARALDGRSLHPRVAVVGAAAGAVALALANASLVLPAGLAVVWLLAMAALSTRHPVREGALLGALALATAAATLAWVRSTGWLAGLGQPSSLLGDAPLLVGKQGRSFLLSQGLSFEELALWNQEIASRGMPLWPSDGYGRNAARLEPWVRAGVALLAIGSVGRVLRARSLGPGVRLQAFFGASLLVGWPTVTLLSQTHGLDPGIPGGINPRYYAHLYPVTLGLLALWAAHRWRSFLLLVALAWMGLHDHQLLWDPAQPTTLAGSPVGTCDATAAWLQEHSDRSPPATRLPLGGKSPAFHRGLLLLERWQHRDYWRWHRPNSAQALDPGSRLTAHIARHPSDVSDPSFWQGAGRALACVYPPGNRGAARAAVEATAATNPAAQAALDALRE